jgi:hypothetical protein
VILNRFVLDGYDATNLTQKEKEDNRDAAEVEYDACWENYDDYFYSDDANYAAYQAALSVCNEGVVANGELIHCKAQYFELTGENEQDYIDKVIQINKPRSGVIK